MEDTREVKSIWFNGANGDEVVRPKENQKLVYMSCYMGDRTEEYVVLQMNGVDVIRYNCRYIATIEWA